MDSDSELTIIKVETVLDYELFFRVSAEQVGQLETQIGSQMIEIQRLKDELHSLRLSNGSLRCQLCQCCRPTVLIVEPEDLIVDDGDHHVYKGRVIRYSPLVDEMLSDI